MYKRLTPCIFIERGKAVQWFDDRTVIADDVMELARHYNERGADELIIFDLSDSDEEHDETINLLQTDQPCNQYSNGCRRKHQTCRRCEEDSLCRSKTCNAEFLQSTFH